MQNDRLLKPKQVAELLGCQMETLARWRCKGIGPKYEKLETGRIRYKESEIQKWLDVNPITPSSFHSKS